MEPLRKLLTLGVNAAVQSGRLSLEAPHSDASTDEKGHLPVNIAGYPSMVLWNSLTVGELRVSVWWNYDHAKHPQADGIGNAKEHFTCSLPLAKRQHFPKFVGATVSGWMERKTGKHLQGHGRQGIFDTYIRTDMRVPLTNLPQPEPTGFGVVGPFFL